MVTAVAMVTNHHFLRLPPSPAPSPSGFLHEDRLGNQKLPGRPFVTAAVTPHPRSLDKPRPQGA